MAGHSIDIRIYYEDTDAGGVVYHGSYLNFAERGRTEYLRAIGHQNTEIRDEHGFIFVVRHMEIDYLKTAKLDELLTLNTVVESVKNTSFIMRQTLRREEEIICDMKVALVCVDTNTLKPVRMPEPLKSKFIEG